MITRRSWFKLFLFLILFLPSGLSFAREELPTATTSAIVEDDNKEDSMDKGKKKKKDSDLDFLQFQMNKLSLRFFLRLALNLFFTFLVIRLVYFPATRQLGFFHTFFIFNTVVFLLTSLLSKVDLSIGTAFGMFAVFSVLRFRTEGLSAKDMTYLFLVIAIGLINAVAKGTFIDLLVINLIILLIAFLLDSNLLLKARDQSKTISYDNIEMIKPVNYSLLLEDLRKRTGLEITRASVDTIDFLKDSCQIVIYYKI